MHLIPAETVLPGMKLDNSYRRLPERFYEMVPPNRVSAPKLLRLNEPLARDLGLDVQRLDRKKLARIFTGDAALDEAGLLSMAYSGHQFGHFNPQMGDGRAGLVTEVLDSAGRHLDIQLKGSGRTPFSRNGDGKAGLGPVMREYIVSEAMHALGISTTRSLAIATTGEHVLRDEIQPGAVLTRIAASHLRIGTFQHFAARGDTEALQILTDYAIKRHYAEMRDQENPPLALLEKLVEVQSALVASWMSIGFIHGVMNTDNMTISGETIDYGPCAFMDFYEHNKVYSSIDRQGRYAYGAQPSMAHWNLVRFAEALVPIIAKDEDQAIKLAKQAIDCFPDRFMTAWSGSMGAKFGLEPQFAASEPGRELMRSFLTLLDREAADFTNTFRQLVSAVQDETARVELHRILGADEQASTWIAGWLANLEALDADDVTSRMVGANPVYIPRNHLVEEAIRAASSDGDLSVMDALLECISRPFELVKGKDRFAKPPMPEEVVHQTFCGT